MCVKTLHCLQNLECDLVLKCGEFDLPIHLIYIYVFTSMPPSFNLECNNKCTCNYQAHPTDSRNGAWLC
jgi:hypothetical protein